jgi:4-hydroxy-tetrahydrodipicolinate synthase
MIGGNATGLHGCGTALITPFTARGDVDEPALRALVEWQLSEGVDFVVPCGSTGEAATLDEREHLLVVGTVAEVVNGRVPVVAGAGSNDTRKVVHLSRACIAAGATHLLLVSPMYNKPPQRGIVRHFQTIADSVDRPIVLYNVPTRTASNMDAATTLALAMHPNIVAVKEASANVAQIEQILRDRPASFAVFSGDDPLTLELMAKGADGVISVASNATPRRISALCTAMGRRDIAAAQREDAALQAWYRAAFIESNPIPVKAALSMLGKCENVLRLPLVPLADAYHAVVRNALVAAGALAA